MARAAGGRVKVPKSCQERALGLLAVRMRSRRELRDRLLHAGFDATEVDEVLGRLERVGLIDDRAFARQVTSYQLGSRLAGSRAARSALTSKGIEPALAEEIVTEGAGDERDESERAEELARLRARRLGGVEPAKAFGRLSSLLMRRGYAPDLARSAARKALGVEGADDEPIGPLPGRRPRRSIVNDRGTTREPYGSQDPSSTRDHDHLRADRRTVEGAGTPRAPSSLTHR